VTGIDLFLNLLKLAKAQGYPVYLLGAKEENLRLCVANIRKQFRGLQIAGFHHGYFGDDEEKVVREIRESGATLLFVAIPSPKKENFIARWKEDLGVKFVMGVGGSFDVVAGVTKRAPRWMQKAGLEWFYRLVQEPRRMWKRYLTTNSLFAVYLLNARFRQFFGGRQS
jgi:N-acetylglucosaminyldiphosphoundecaprenol N-acetyl-beta-D-mannosaminyltransferase